MNKTNCNTTVSRDVISRYVDVVAFENQQPKAISRRIGAYAFVADLLETFPEGLPENYKLLAELALASVVKDMGHVWAFIRADYPYSQLCLYVNVDGISQPVILSFPKLHEHADKIRYLHTLSFAVSHWFPTALSVEIVDIKVDSNDVTERVKLNLSQHMNLPFLPAA